VPFPVAGPLSREEAPTPTVESEQAHDARGGASLELSTRPRKRSDIVLRRVVGETILVPIEGPPGEPCIYTLNEVGAFLWERADGSRTLSDLIALIGSEFESPPPDIEAEVRRFIEILALEHLLEVEI